MTKPEVSLVKVTETGASQIEAGFHELIRSLGGVERIIPAGGPGGF